MSTPSQPPPWVKPWIGHRFELGAAGPDRFDCYGLYRAVSAARLGLLLPARAILTRPGQIDREAIAEAIEADVAGGDWAVTEEPEVGDAAIFRIGARLGHVGMVVARGWMLHVTPDTDSVAERIDTPAWSSRLEGFFRYVAPARLSANTTAIGGGIAHVVTEAGQTIEEILRAAEIDASSRGLVVALAGCTVPRQYWGRVRPKPGRSLVVGVQIAGSDQGKTPARIALTIGVVAAAALVPALAVGPAGLALKAGSFAALATKAAIGTGIAVGGTLLTNLIAPPPTPKFKSLSGDQSGLSPTLSGSRNEIRQFAPIPSVFGTFRFAPPFGAKPFTEQLGDDEYLRVMYLPGYGETLIEDVRIGATSISEFEGVELEIRQGVPGEDPSRIVPGDVDQEDVTVELIEAEGFTTRTTGDGVDEISLDFIAPAGLAELDRAGDRTTASVALTIEYRETGTSGDWLSPAGPSVAPTGQRSMDLLFREPEAVRLGAQVGVVGSNSLQHPLQWSGNSIFGGTKPTFLPADTFGVRMYGYIEIPDVGGPFSQAGPQTSWALECSDAAELYIDGRLVLSSYGTRTAQASGSNPEFSDLTTSPALFTKGRHRIEVRLYATDGNPGDVAVGWRFGASGSFSSVPAAALGIYEVGPFGPTGDVLYGRLYYEWFDGSGYTSNLEISDNRTEPIRRTFTFGVPRGQYDVRVRRDTPDTSDTSIVDEIFWRTFRWITHADPVAVEGVSRIALRIRASNQLNGVLDTLNAKVSRVIPDFDPDTGQWTPRVTSNPASCYRAALQSRGTPVNNKAGASDDEINIADLEDWWQFCNDNGFTFDAVYDFETTLGEVLSDIASAGRASPAIDSSGRYTIVIDRPQDTPRQHFTPRNSHRIRGRASFADRPHGLKIRFYSREADWQQDERIVLDDGYQYDGVDAFGEDGGDLPEATLFDVVEMFGVTSADLAWRHGRYQIAVARLRPEVITFDTDIEHLAVARGDLFHLTSDAFLVGLGASRISRITLDEADNIVGLALDDTVRMEADESYGVRVRSSETGESFLLSVVTAEGETDRLSLTNPIPFDFDPIPRVGDLVAFGEFGTESLDLIVAGVNMGGELSAVISAVSHAPAVHLADQGEIPPWDPNITDPPDINLGPDDPIIVSVRSDDYVMVRGADGSLQPRIVVTLGIPPASRPKPDYAEIQIRAKPTGGIDPAGPYREIGPVSIENHRISIDGVDEGVTYEIRIRVLTDSGRASGWVEFEHTVIGKQLPPPVVEEFDVVRLSDGTRRYIWDLGLIPPDIAGVVIRYGPGGQGLLWDQLSPLHTEVLQGSPQELNFPASGTWTFGIKMRDTSGNESTAAVLIDRTLGPPREENVAFSEEAFALGWPGTKTDASVDALGFLVVDDESTWATLPATWATWPVWTGNPKDEFIYEHSVIDIGFVLDFIPSATAEGLGDFLIEFRYRSSTGDAWSSYAEVDPLNEIAITGRYVQFRITVTAQSLNQVIYLSRFLMQVRAPTRTLIIEDLDTSSLPASLRLGVGDVRLPINSSAFNIIRTVSLTFNGMGAGFSWELVDKSTEDGPRVRIFGPDDLPSEAIIDAVIRGL